MRLSDGNVRCEAIGVLDLAWVAIDVAADEAGSLWLVHALGYELD